MAFEIYVKDSIGTWKLEATAATQAEATDKLAVLIQVMSINKILLTETLPYTVTYDSETREYNASYPQEQS